MSTEYATNMCLRISADDRRRLEHAASAAGISLSEFVRRASIDEAERQREERIERGVSSFLEEDE